MNLKATIPISEQLIKTLFPIKKKSNKDENIRGFVYTFNKYANYFGIDTSLETAHFISQLAHESDQFNAFEEYASGAAYEGRKDLGNTYKGDGVRFKGRGPIQTTGRTNYIEVGKELLKLPFLLDCEKKLFENNNILKNPKLISDPVWGTLAALIYWTKKDINPLCKEENTKVTIMRYNGKRWYKYTCDSVEAVTRKINGGVNGLAERRKYFRKVVASI